VQRKERHEGADGGTAEFKIGGGNQGEVFGFREKNGLWGLRWRGLVWGRGTQRKKGQLGRKFKKNGIEIKLTIERLF